MAALRRYARTAQATAAAALSVVAVGGLAWRADGRGPVAGHRWHWRMTTLAVGQARAFSYAEPGIAVGPGGLLVADAATANTGAPPTFWLSRDGGQSWSVGRDFDPTKTSTGDADAAIGPDGFLYALNLGYSARGQTSNPTVLVFRSPDGRRWSGPASFPPPHGLDQPDRPWLVVDPRRPADVDVFNSEVAGNIVMWRSNDHGARFSGPFAVTETANSAAALALSSRPLFDPSHAGRMFMLYETASAGSTPSAEAQRPPYEFPLRALWLATSTDSGRTWSNHLVLDTTALRGRLHGATLGHLLVACAIDRAGRLYAAFSARWQSSTRTALYVIHSTRQGSVWSQPFRIRTSTRSNVMPALAVSPRGVAYLSWYGSPSPDFRSATAAWQEMFARMPNPLSAHPHVTVTQVSGRVPVHVGGIDTAGTVGSDVGANWGLRDFQSIAVGRCGEPHLVWAVDNRRKATQTAFLSPTCRR